MLWLCRSPEMQIQIINSLGGKGVIGNSVIAWLQFSLSASEPFVTKIQTAGQRLFKKVFGRNRKRRARLSDSGRRGSKVNIFIIILINIISSNTLWRFCQICGFTIITLNRRFEPGRENNTAYLPVMDAYQKSKFRSGSPAEVCLSSHKWCLIIRSFCP